MLGRETFYTLFIFAVHDLPRTQTAELIYAPSAPLCPVTERYGDTFRTLANVGKSINEPRGTLMLVSCRCECTEWIAILGGLNASPIIRRDWTSATREKNARGNSSRRGTIIPERFNLFLEYISRDVPVARVTERHTLRFRRRNFATRFPLNACEASVDCCPRYFARADAFERFIYSGWDRGSCERISAALYSIDALSKECLPRERSRVRNGPQLSAATSAIELDSQRVSYTWS